MGFLVSQALWDGVTDDPCFISRCKEKAHFVHILDCSRTR